MSKFFSLESPMWGFFNKIANLFLLNLCFIVCSVPIVTIGASWTALYYVGMKMVRGEEKSVIKEFLFSFRQNFKQATVMWLLDLLLFAVFILDLFVISGMQGDVKSMLHMSIVVLLVVLLTITAYSFPLLARFENTVLNMYKNAFVMALRHIGFTVIIMGITLAPFLIFLVDSSTVPAIVMIYVFLGFGFSAYCNSFLFTKIFAKYMEK